MTDPALRPMTPADIPAIRALHDSAFAASVTDPAVAAAFAAMTAAPDYAEDLLRSDLWLAERDGALLGTAGWLAAGEAARLRKVFVHPAAWRGGLGTRLIRAAEGRAASAGFARLIVRANLFAVPLYRRLGYVEERAFAMDLPGGLTTPVVLMRRDRAEIA